MTQRRVIVTIRLVRGFATLLIAASVAAGIIACQQGRNERPRSWSAASLGVPQADRPWKLMAHVKGAPVSLQIPQDLPAIARYPADVQAGIRARIQLRDRNVEVLGHLAGEAERLLKDKAFTSVPQYERTMNEIVLGIDQTDVVKGDPLYKHADVLHNLPSYTHVELFVPAEYATTARVRLRAMNILNRVTINPVDIWARQWEDLTLEHGCSAWTQDMFRVSRDAQGKEYLFTPATFDQAVDLSQPDNDFLLHLIDGGPDRTVVRLPIFFHVGNIILGEGRLRTLFVGDRTLALNTKMFFDAAQALPDRQSLLDLLQAISSADEVRVVRNSDTLVHVDMVMIMLGRGIAGLIEPLDPGNVRPEDRDVLNEVRTLLAGLGYRIVPIPTLARRMAADQSPVNIVPYVDRTTGSRVAIVPQFPDEEVIVRGASRSLNAMIREAYEAAGFRVVPVADHFSYRRGNIHCVLKVIN